MKGIGDGPSPRQLTTLTWAPFHTPIPNSFASSSNSMDIRSTSLLKAEGSLIVFGGFDNNECILQDLYTYNLSTWTWSHLKTKGIPPGPRQGHSSQYFMNFKGQRQLIWRGHLSNFTSKFKSRNHE